MIMKELIEHLQGYRPDQTVACLIWLEDDVKTKAKEMGVRLTKDQITSVLENVEHKKDASLGISWDTLEFWIGEEVSPPCHVTQ